MFYKHAYVGNTHTQKTQQKEISLRYLGMLNKMKTIASSVINGNMNCYYLLSSQHV